MSEPDPLSGLVNHARAGNRAALEDLITQIMPKIYGLTLRMLWDVEDARDASQEIMIRIITNLGTFRGESEFTTWAYRVAANYILTFRETQMEKRQMTFTVFGDDLENYLEDTAARRPEDSLLLEELRIGCTMAMLTCLDRDHRLAYIVGEILELGHKEAARVLGIAPSTFRKRASRARGRIVAFMQNHCGLIDERNRCRCHRRLIPALQLGRVVPGKLHFAGDEAIALRFPMAIAGVRRLETAQRAAALYQLQQERVPGELVSAIRLLLERFEANR